ncbi:bola-like protein [Gymnopilus junonius]|uniref:Bola-like protein n=1 Tax=Gymnopilus junonius TaxID=109634 RepID=A0A9P5TPC4_GYMJU|nr:bola-like protein [Gymnopilus junonius]
MLALRRLFHPPTASGRAFSASSKWRNTTFNSSLTEGEQLIHAKLTAKFSPSQLQVQDVSGGCGTFYAITIASDSFKGLPIVKQHQLVTKTLKEDISGFHGLQIKTIAT